MIINVIRELHSRFVLNSEYVKYLYESKHKKVERKIEKLALRELVLILNCSSLNFELVDVCFFAFILGKYDVS